MITAEKNKHLLSLWQRGFTLVELMVTLAVAAIVLAVAVPSFGSLIVNNALTSEANQLVSAFNTARNEAIKLNQNTRLCHSVDGADCSAPDTDGWQGWIVVDINDRVIASGFFSEKLSITATENTDVILFTANGLIRRNNTSVPLSGTFSICSGSARGDRNTRLVTFVSGGRISINAVHIEGCA